MSLHYYIGTSGWHYDHWRDRFYPGELVKAKWLEFYTGFFNTVELNNSFYRLPSEAAFAAWDKSSPADFIFSVKVSRFITHIKRLRNVGDAVERFTGRVELLRDKLGPLLYQLPPNMHRDGEVLELFLSSLPRGIKHVLEFRHDSWFNESIFKMLRNYNAGFCIFDIPLVSCPLIVTADFAYLRFHGSTGLYASCYSDEELARWAGKIADLTSDLKETYIYFNNDAEGFAVRNALTLRDYLQTG